MVRHFDALPGLHGVRDRLPVRRAVRPAHRGHPGPGGAPAPRGRAQNGCCAGRSSRLFPYPRRLRLLRGPLRAYQASGLQRLLAPGAGAARRRWRRWSRWRPGCGRPERLPDVCAARGPRRAVVGMLTGCVQRRLLPRGQRRHRAGAGRRGLRRGACRAAQGCCGALSVHAGREAEARRSPARSSTPSSGAGVDYLVVNAAGCGSSLKDYGDLLRDDPVYAERAAALRRQGARRVRDPRRARPGGAAASAAADRRLPRRLPPRPRPGRTRAAARAARAASPAWSCARSPTRRSAAARPASGTCSTPSPAGELGDRKARDVLATGADLLVTANPGCLMQVAAAVRRPGGRSALAHTAQVLDASIRGLPAQSLLDS